MSLFITTNPIQGTGVLRIYGKISFNLLEYHERTPVAAPSINFVSTAIYISLVDILTGTMPTAFNISIGKVPDPLILSPFISARLSFLSFKKRTLGGSHKYR